MQLRVAQGTMLAAWPDLMDPNFMHSVLLMCHHTEEGAYGLVVNRLTTFSLGDLFPEHDTLGALVFPVHQGGPVEASSTLQFIHTVPDAIPGGMPLAGERLWLGGELDALGDYLAAQSGEAASRVRVFLGYSGWGAGQLEHELQNRSWIPAPMDLRAVFGTNPTVTWKRVIRSVEKGEAGLRDLPPDVSWN